MKASELCCENTCGEQYLHFVIYEFPYLIIFDMKLNYKVNVHNIYCTNVQHVHSIKNSMPRYCEYEWKWKYAYIPVNIIIGIIIFGKYIS